jgi:hypothetical protein
MESAPAHDKDPAIYSDTPPMSTGRLPNRSASGPCSRRNALKLMKNATSDRLACASVMLQMVHSVGMAGRYMSVDKGGNAASNMIRIKLFIVFFVKAKRPAKNSPAVIAYNIRTLFSQERIIDIQPEKAFGMYLRKFHMRNLKDIIIYAIPAWTF